MGGTAQVLNIELMTKISTMLGTIKKNENLAALLAQSRLDKAEIEDAKNKRVQFVMHERDILLAGAEIQKTDRATLQMKFDVSVGMAYDAALNHRAGSVLLRRRSLRAGMTSLLSDTAPCHHVRCVHLQQCCHQHGRQACSTSTHNISFERYRAMPSCWRRHLRQRCHRRVRRACSTSRHYISFGQYDAMQSWQMCSPTAVTPSACAAGKQRPQALRRVRAM